MLKLIVICCMLQWSVSAQLKSDVFEIARTGTMSAAKVVVEQNPDAFNTVDGRGFSPLILACYRGNNDVAKYLIDIGASINKTSNMGTALMASIVKGNTEIANLLIEKGCDLNLTDDAGTTALMYAVQFRNVEVVQMLLQHNANKATTDSKGKTAFEYAVFSGNETIINLLK